MIKTVKMNVLAIIEIASKVFKLKSLLEFVNKTISIKGVWVLVCVVFFIVYKQDKRISFLEKKHQLAVIHKVEHNTINKIKEKIANLQQQRQDVFFATYLRKSTTNSYTGQILFLSKIDIMLCNKKSIINNNHSCLINKSSSAHEMLHSLLFGNEVSDSFNYGLIYTMDRIELPFNNNDMSVYCTSYIYKKNSKVFLIAKDILQSEEVYAYGCRLSDVYGVVMFSGKKLCIACDDGKSICNKCDKEFFNHNFSSVFEVWADEYSKEQKEF